MADNVAITAGTGTTVSTEEVTTLNGATVSAQHVQRMGAAVVTADGVAKDLLLGRNSDATSLSAALSTEDVALVGSLTETAPASDTASSGLNGRLQRVAQRLTTLIGLLPTALGANGGLKIEGVSGGVAVPTTSANLPTTVDTNSGNKSASTLRVVLATDQPALTNAQPVSLATAPALVAGEAHIGAVGGHSTPVYGTMTRTADTNIYASGDGVTTATSSASGMTVSNAARVSGGSGFISGGRMSKSTTSTTAASFRGWIYQATPTAIPNDNAAFTAAVHADYQKLVATFTVDFSATGIVGSDGVYSPITLSRPNPFFKVASGQDLIVILEARGAYTPGSAEVFRLGLDVSQD